MIFGLYKVVYKFGLFDIILFRGVLFDYVFGDEKVEGGEVGIKLRLFDW